MAETLKTADGVEVKPGMLLHVRGPWWDHVEKVDRIEDGAAWSAYPGTKFSGGRFDLTRCYTTREAAQQKGGQ